MKDNHRQNTISKLAKNGKLSRREFIQGMIATGMTAAAASSLWSTEVQALTPNKGGHFKMAIGGGATSDTLDPGTYFESYMQTVGFGLRNCLAQLDNEDKLVPELAESWDSNDDSTVWTIKLKKGVEFHNGKTFDADDAIASLEHHLGEESKSAAKALLAPISEIKKQDANTIQINLTDGNVGFPALLTDYHINMMPVIDGKLDVMSGIGTGPYTLKNFNAGVRTELERNPNYWKEGAGHFDSCELLSVIDVPARTNALLTGEVDAVHRLDLKTLSRLENAPGISIKETQGSQFYAFPMQVNVAPYDNYDVRMALKFGIDRQETLDKLLFGHGYIGNDSPIGKSYEFYTELPQREYDPDKAKFHLQKAGMDGLEVEINVADAAFAGAIDAAVLYAETLKKAGIKLNVVREPNDGYWTNVFKVKPWFATYWNPRASEDMMFSTAFAADAEWNECNWKNPRFNELLKLARIEKDVAKRTEMYTEMQQLISDDSGYVLPVFANYVFGTSDKIGHNRMAASWDLDGVRCLERWWFA